MRITVAGQPRARNPVSPSIATVSNVVGEAVITIRVYPQMTIVHRVESAGPRHREPVGVRAWLGEQGAVPRPAVVVVADDVAVVTIADPAKGAGEVVPDGPARLSSFTAPSIR
jgi:hypothetical protein